MGEDEAAAALFVAFGTDGICPTVAGDLFFDGDRDLSRFVRRFIFLSPSPGLILADGDRGVLFSLSPISDTVPPPHYWNTLIDYA